MSTLDENRACFIFRFDNEKRLAGTLSREKRKRPDISEFDWISVILQHEETRIQISAPGAILDQRVRNFSAINHFKTIVFDRDARRA